MKLGIIVCAHGNKRAVSRLCRKYLNNKVDAIAFCGDMGDDYKEINSVLKAAKAKVPVIAFPGSHEPSKDYYKALKKNKKIIDGTRKRRIRISGYDIVTLPGSGVFTFKSGFRLAGKKLPKGLKRKFKHFHINKLGKYVKNPGKTIILTHDPPKGSNKNGIDVAHSGIVNRAFVVKEKHLKKLGKELFAVGIAMKGEIFTLPYAKKFAKLGYPVSVKHRNVGNVQLKKFLKKKKIPFFACGHIHEAGQRAVSSSGKPLKQGKLSKSVWYNAAPAVKGRGGILVIEGKQAKYKNIKA